MKRLTVKAASRTYPIVIGRGVLGDAGAAVRRARGDGQVVVCCDENVAPLYLEGLRAGLRVGRSRSLPGDPARR